MFRLFKTLVIQNSVPIGSIASPFKSLFKMQLLIRSPIAIAVHSKGGASKSSSSSNSESKSKEKPKPSCKRSARKKKCSKIPAPSPSYSECRREPTVPKPFKECDCGDFDKC